MKLQLIICAFLAGFIFTGCEKNDGMVPKEYAIERVPTPLINKNGGSAAIDMTNLGGFQGKFDVALFYPGDIPPSKFDVVVRKNNSNSTVKVFQAGLTSFPSTLTISAAQISTLFGAISLGDNYDVSVDVYAQSGKKYSAFPLNGQTAYAPGIGGQPGANTSIRYSAICQFNSADFQGNFVVVEDEFADTSPGDIIVVTRIDDTHFSYIYPSGVNPKPIVVTVNPLTNDISVALQTFGTEYTWQSTYKFPTIQSKADPRNVVAPCAKEWGFAAEYGLTFNGTSGLVFSGGPFYFKLRKQ